MVESMKSRGHQGQNSDYESDWFCTFLCRQSNHAVNGKTKAYDGVLIPLSTLSTKGNTREDPIMLNDDDDDDVNKEDR